jgi:hypothetical protein
METTYLCVDFIEKLYHVNWLSNWVEQRNLQYDWTQATAVQTYVVSSFTLLVGCAVLSFAAQ